MCICPSELYKWLRAFKVVTGGGAANLVYGEMLITNNERASIEAFPSTTWFKVQAGNPNTPPGTPDYTLYGPGDLNGWSFDEVNARLVYDGASSGYFKVTVSLSVAMDAGTTSFLAFALRQNDDITTENELFLKSLAQMTAREGVLGSLPINNGDTVSLQASNFFNPGDFIDIVFQNNSTANAPIVASMNFFVSSLGNANAPLTPLFVVSDLGDNIVDDLGNQLIAEQ